MPAKEFLDGKFFGVFITLLILYSLVTFSIETLPDLDESTLTFLTYSEILVVAVFTLEYICRVITAENKVKFIFSFYGLVDFLAVIPFYLATSVDLRTLRLLRLLRLVRILKMVRYNKAINRFGRALAETKEELVIFTFAALIMLFLSSVGIYHFEHDAQPKVYGTIFDCLWWSVATLTTVGYGDIYPITLGGKIFTFCILLIGLGLIAVPASIMASSLTAIRRQEELKNGVQD